MLNPKSKRWLSRSLCNSMPQCVSRKLRSPRGSFCELSRCLVKWLLNCLCLLPPVSHRPKGCPWGREGSDPRYPFAKSLRLWGWTDLCLKRALKLWRERYHRSANACNSSPAEWHGNWIALSWNFRALWLVSGNHTMVFWKCFLLYRLLFVLSVPSPS